MRYDRLPDGDYLPPTAKALEQARYAAGYRPGLAERHGCGILAALCIAVMLWRW